MDYIELSKIPQISQETAHELINQSNKWRMAGNKLKKARERLGRTKEDIARICYMSVKEYSDAEQGHFQDYERISGILSFLLEEEEYIALSRESKTPIPSGFNIVVSEGNGLKVCTNNRGKYILELTCEA